MAGLVVSIRLVGLLQVWELAALDQLIRLRPPEPVDDRIVIVGVDEADLRNAGQYPMSDR
ncbi:CHASE2 domain-containing protein [Leptodesmis sp.]|uniref:CHASE2 domain-containing protein n=1 Tax=Leptodesmis sp. TaxID=3100501 RepID=UPI0040534CC9